jgi:hypothetical protein
MGAGLPEAGAVITRSNEHALGEIDDDGRPDRFYRHYRYVCRCGRAGPWRPSVNLARGDHAVHRTSEPASMMPPQMRALVRIVSSDRRHRYEGLTICHEHLRQIEADLPFEELPAEQVSFWGDRCFMCGIASAPGRLCENKDCRCPLHPQWPAIYCCNECALKDA